MSKARSPYPEFEDWFRTLLSDEVTREADLPAPLALDYVGRLFRESGRVLAGHSDAAVASALSRVISPEESSELRAVNDASLPMQRRIGCVEAIGELFAHTFAPRCERRLSHTGEAASPLNTVCFMWWDTAVLHARPDRWPDLDSACLAVMRQCLELPSVACWESALHGLGHWVSDYPEVVRGAIDGFLASRQRHRPALLDYAMRARAGSVM